uniref:Uncharacterized protein n=1 Tax=Pygocentrus nattereri TaxID=42514 RepID=A0AAR2LKZ4_PYGNA
LHRISSDCSNLCFKCKQERGTYMHCFWSCDKIQFYRKGIHCELEKILRIRLVFSPAMFLSNLDMESCGFSTTNMQYTSSYQALNLFITSMSTC